MSWAELYTAILNTLVVSAGVTGLVLPLSLCLAILIIRTDVLGSRWAWLVLFSQLVVPLYALVGAWSAGFGTQGWWPLSQVMVAGNSWASLGAVTFIHAMAAIPSCVLILALGLHWTRRSREELALVDGGKRNLLLRVLLPELRGWIAAATLWTIVPVLTEMVVTNLYQVPTLPEQVYLDISLGTATTQTYLVSIGLCTLPILMAAWWLRRQLPELSTLAPQIAEHPPRPLALGKWRWPLSALVWLMVTLIVLVPLTNLLIKAGWASQLDSQGLMQHHWSAMRLMQTLWETCTLFGDEFRWSAALSVASATLALSLASTVRAMIASIGYAKSQPQRFRWLVSGLCVLLIALPGPLVAALMSQLFLNVPGLDWWYDHTLLAPVLAQQTRLFPLAWLLVSGILSSLSRQAWELAEVDQLSIWQRWWTIVWRPTRGLWLLAWLLLAAVSAGELSTHLLLLPPGVTTVSQRLFELLHFGMRYQDSGLCLALVLIGWLVAVVVWNTRAGRA